ncbi:hypothetical protein JYU34_018453 [Plutella xylostella]|uniref:Uncharacterized protein n=1 Tax=Plutella xylostella TaxID=51655 RepID=A0ABQ7PZ18_PLUXY|nr:hypothetical protein JYU34_018453 [Plutella xylostella]
MKSHRSPARHQIECPPPPPPRATKSPSMGRPNAFDHRLLRNGRAGSLLIAAIAVMSGAAAGMRGASCGHQGHTDTSSDQQYQYM